MTMMVVIAGDEKGQLTKHRPTQHLKGPSELQVVSVKVGALKMHDLKMTDKENYGSGKYRTGK